MPYFPSLGTINNRYKKEKMFENYCLWPHCYMPFMNEVFVFKTSAKNMPDHSNNYICRLFFVEILIPFKITGSLTKNQPEKKDVVSFLATTMVTKTNITIAAVMGVERLIWCVGKRTETRIM